MDIWTSFVILVVLLINLSWVLSTYLSKINKIILYVCILILVASEVAVALLLRIEYALELAIFLQFLAFLCEALYGKLFQRPQKNFSDLSFPELFYFIAYDLIFKGLYFFYAIATFPDGLSEDMRPFGYGFILLVFVVLILTNNKMNKNKEMADYFHT